MSSPATYPVSTIAKLLNLTERRIQQLVKENVLPPPVKQRYNLVACVQGYIQYLQEKAAGIKNETIDIHKERARLIRAQADKTEIERDVLKQKLVLIEDAELEFANQILKCRSKLLALAPRAATRVIAITDYAEAEEILNNIVREALDELTGGARELDSGNDSAGNEEVRTAAKPNRKRVGKQVSPPKP